MSDDFAMELAGALFALWLLYVYWLIWIKPIWINRRQPIRKDAPTGGPWVKPEIPERWKDAS